MFSDNVRLIMDHCGFVAADERDAITTHEMTERENHGAVLGISRLTMMENAGSAVARFIAGSFEKGNVLLVAGTGNNGGDAFVTARHLAYWVNFNITLALVGNESNIRALEAVANWNVLKKIPQVRIMNIDSLERATRLKDSLEECQIVICAIFGTGFKGKPRELQGSVIQAINDSNATKVSIDLPSGMDADSGGCEFAVKSDYTITMDSPKVGMFANEKSRKVCGNILVTNIGVPK
ncbi:MAG: NAD(P)H-hydrate epimerase [Nitrososphaerales archaeon]|jgi:NAD(P)H-hydrate epimerase